MAGGEIAKKSGEYGEKIVANLLKMIGWENLHSGVSVPCMFAEKHTKSGTEKSIKHGIDYVYQYKCPLRDSTKHDVLISVKCRDGYPKTETTIKTKFKEFLMDLAHAMECYPGCDISRKKINSTNKKVTSGLIFWIDRKQGDGRENLSVTNNIGNFYFKEECVYDTIALVDNKRAQFLYSILYFIQNKYGDYGFFYINTGLNNSSLDRVYTGKRMPFEYINSDVIPLSVVQDKSKILILAVNSNFNEEHLKRLIGLAQELTNTWTANVVIAFPDYNEFEHQEDVIKAKSSFEDEDFVKSLQVITFLPDFRDGVE